MYESIILFLQANLVGYTSFHSVFCCNYCIWILWDWKYYLINNAWNIFYWKSCVIKHNHSTIQIPVSKLQNILEVLTFELWLCSSSCNFWLTHFNTYSSFYQFSNDNICSHKDLIWHNFLLHYFLSSQVHPQFASIVQIIQWNKNYILPNMEKTKNNVQIFTPYRLIQKHNHDKNVMKS